MINYIPQIYPDELVYSLFCRYYVHSGCVSHKAALSDIFCKRSDNPSKEFIGHLNADAQNQIEKCYPIKELILKNTMFPQYARFIPLSQKEKAMYHFEFEYCDAHHLFAILPRTDADGFLRYCPLCVEEDRQKYGEAYWHRTHQIRNMQICSKHKCYLEQSEVTAKSEKCFTFCPAEEYCKVIEPRIADNADSLRYAEYLSDVFNSSLDFSKDIPINTVFYYAMADTPYMKSSGKTRYTKELSDRLKAYFETIGINDIASMYQIQRVLLGNRFDFSVVCQVAFFLGISVTDLTAPQITQEQIETEKATHTMKDKEPINWQEYDGELAPVLEKVAKGIYYGTANENGRPDRVSEKMIYRELELSAHRLEKLPQCRRIFERYSETYEESWARRVIWAYRKLSEQQKPFYWSDIRLVSGVKKKNIGKVIPFIEKYADKSTANHIISIIGNIPL